MPVGIYLFKVNNRNIRRCEICSKLTRKTPERRQWRRSGVFIVNFEHISLFVLIFLLLTWSTQMPTGNALYEFLLVFSYSNKFATCFGGFHLRMALNLLKHNLVIPQACSAFLKYALQDISFTSSKTMPFSYTSFT